MAENAPDRIKYYLRIDKVLQNDLAELREWTNLKVAFEKNEIWITNFTVEQIESSRVKKVPYKTVYYSKKGMLYLQNSRLPELREPTFLWTPFTRAAPIKLSAYNHNYFGVKEELNVKLIDSELTRESAAMSTSLDVLSQFIQTAPAIRLKKLTWTIVNDNKALVFGTPLLPIDGEVFWQKGTLFLPIGYDFEIPILTDLIDAKINFEKEHYILWEKEGKFIRIPIESIGELTISSFRKSVRMNENTKELTVNAS